MIFIDVDFEAHFGLRTISLLCRRSTGCTFSSTSKCTNENLHVFTAPSLHLSVHLPSPHPLLPPPSASPRGWTVWPRSAPGLWRWRRELVPAPPACGSWRLRGSWWGRGWGQGRKLETQKNCIYYFNNYEDYSNKLSLPVDAVFYERRVTSGLKLDSDKVLLVYDTSVVFNSDAETFFCFRGCDLEGGNQIIHASHCSLKLPPYQMSSLNFQEKTFHGDSFTAEKFTNVIKTFIILKGGVQLHRCDRRDH